MKTKSIFRLTKIFVLPIIFVVSVFSQTFLNDLSVCKVIPELPKIAVKKNIKPNVLLKITVNEEGKVIKSRVIKGHSWLRLRAVEAVKKTIFKITEKDGKAVKISGNYLVGFKSPNSKKFPIISMGVVNGKALYLEIPKYPATAQAVNLSGQVQVKVLIDEYGKVIETEIISGHPLLRANSRKAAQNSRFQTVCLSGTAIKGSGLIIYNYVK